MPLQVHERHREPVATGSVKSGRFILAAVHVLSITSAPRTIDLVRRGVFQSCAAKAARSGLLPGSLSVVLSYCIKTLPLNKPVFGVLLEDFHDTLLFRGV